MSLLAKTIPCIMPAKNFSNIFEYFSLYTSNENKEKYQLGDYKLIQYQILQTNIIRTV